MWPLAVLGKLFFRCWKLILKNGLVGGGYNVLWEYKSRMFHQELLSPLEMEVEGNERPHQKGC